MIFFFITKSAFPTIFLATTKDGHTDISDSLNTPILNNFLTHT
jgi:hypothetical protein